MTTMRVHFLDETVEFSWHDVEADDIVEGATQMFLVLRKFSAIKLSEVSVPRGLRATTFDEQRGVSC